MSRPRFCVVVPFAMLVVTGCLAPPDTSYADQQIRQIVATQSQMAMHLERLLTNVDLLEDRILQMGLGVHDTSTPQITIVQNSAATKRTSHGTEVNTVTLASSSLATATLQTALRALKTQMDVHRDNIANVNTNGFKRSEVSFADIAYESSPAEATAGRTTAATTNTHNLIGCGTRIRAITKIYTPGVLESTGRNLDIAIVGRGFLEVLMPDGTSAFTRDGRLQVNADGKITTSSGCVILPKITLPQDLLDISFSADGSITGRTGGSPDTTSCFGSLQLKRIANPAGLRSIGENLAVETERSGRSCSALPGNGGTGRIRQSFLERSNVDVMNEYVALQIAARQFTLVQQLLLSR